MATDTSGGTATAPPNAPDRLRRPDSRQSTLNRIQHVLHANPILGPLAVLVVAIIAFAIVNGRFLSAANLGLVLQQVTVIATLALGQTLVILTAGIDLSAGAIAVFSSILMANMATKLGVPGVLALIDRPRCSAPRWARSTGCWSPGSTCPRSSSRWAHCRSSSR